MSEAPPDETKGKVSIPGWALTIIISVISWGAGTLMQVGGRSNQLDSVIAQTTAVQVSLANISEKLSKIQSHEEAGDQKFSDLDRRITAVETLVERSREQLETMKADRNR